MANIWDRINPFKQVSAAMELVGRKQNWQDRGLSEMFGQPTTSKSILESIVRPASAAESSRTTSTGGGGSWGGEPPVQGPIYTGPQSVQQQPTYQPQPQQQVQQSSPGEQDWARATLAGLESGRIQFDSTLQSKARDILNPPQAQTAGISSTAFAGETKAEQDRLEAIKTEKEAAMRSGIAQKYQGLYADFDRKLGLLPEQKAGYDADVERMVNLIKAEAGVAETKATGAYSEAESKALSQSGKSLRELAESGRGILGAIANIYGGSAVTPYITSAVTKQITKQRGEIFRQRDEFLQGIESQKANLVKEIGLENTKIETWKQSQLKSIADWLRTKTDELDTQKSGASQAEIADLQDFESQLFADAQTRLLNLDSMVWEGKQALNLYQVQTATELNAYKQKLEMASQYQTPSFGWDLSSLTPGQAQTLASATGQRVPSYGSWISPKTDEEKERMIDDIPHIWDPVQNAYVPRNVVGGSTAGNLLEEGGFR